MSARIRPDTAAHYELRIAGHLAAHWSAWFGGLTLSQEADGTTTLRGVLADQAELHGLLAKVRDLGATLISVNATGVPSTQPRTPMETDADKHPRTGHVRAPASRLPR